ncbi:MAG: L28 family ribosomal protein [Patescibacteria group bacterium]|jgi:large subunit ribosomal protein L28
MSKACSVCGRGTRSSFSVSHSNIKSKRTQKINLKSKRLDGKSTAICTACLKTKAKKQK